ncbi:phage late control gene D protein (GPD) [Phaeobacter porticola]|uniref:Phage late control gene D protein (GPD) n=1 Tax=Phaeobacter porticola TaxID=1844006 RepID=A0A1L3I302_9RHOB|nr:phage late control gene D protein (GPD) [Phaeobacter porticola]
MASNMSIWPNEPKATSIFWPGSARNMTPSCRSKRAACCSSAREKGKSASGTVVLPQIWVFKSQLMPGCRVSKDKATAYKGVKAIWHDKKLGEKKTVTGGEGSPAYEMTHPYRTEEAAQRAAKSKLDKQTRAGHSISLILVGDPILRAEGQALVVGLRPSIPPLWSITGVTHRLGSGGYTTQIRGNCQSARDDLTGARSNFKCAPVREFSGRSSVSTV